MVGFSAGRIWVYCVRWMWIGVAVGCFIGCAAPTEQIRFASDGARPTETDIDQDPWRLLPRGAVAFFRTDSSIWEADFGDDLAKALIEHLPLPSAVAVSPQSDIQLVVGAAYATVNNDVAFVCQGRFDREALNGALTSSSKNALGEEIVSIVFAGETMHVAGAFAMAVLSSKTMVFGTQLGVRRVLEVVEEGRLARELPAWFETLLKTPDAAVQVGIDLDAQAVPTVFRTRLEFLNHLRAARLLGNYKGGGINLAGALTFDTPQAAETAATEVNSAEEQLDRYRFLVQSLGLPQLFRRVAAQATGKDVQFAVEVESDAVSYLIEKGSEVSALFMEQEQ